MGDFTHAARRPKGLSAAIAATAPMIALPQSDLYSLLLSQVRYSMGRMTYIVGECCRRVREYWKDLEPAHRSMILRDVTEELDCYERAGKLCGMDFDHREWVALREWMREHLKD